ncbi:hypothetical protein K466DRAFT_607324 [Polyporus arcularius HHB13444]|uniref:Uncharacterized protein n=1 Tax=Polyporus arcularius HHB13444 TaxID=1314778 RepID=A0A5C3NLK3_9APHY|nr:hypothetical protein K466DRAFT_607324 [Polyporus arcularius HHB13444]
MDVTRAVSTDAGERNENLGKPQAGMYPIASSDHIRAQTNPHMQDSAGRAESLNEAVNKLPHPLTLLTRDHLNMARTSPDVEQWRLGQSGWGVKAPTEQQVDNRATPETWGAPEGGNWGPIEEPEPGTIGLVRTGGDGQHNEGRVAIKLAGLSVARVNWNYLDEMLLPLPADFQQASSWPDIPDLNVSYGNLGDHARRCLREFQQVFAWYGRPHPDDYAQLMIDLWSSLWEVLEAETDADGANPGSAVSRVLQHAHAILPGEVWQYPVPVLGEFYAEGWGEGHGR